jgi:hypothetical protein
MPGYESGVGVRLGPGSAPGNHPCQRWAMDALPAVNRPPLCTLSPILGSGSLSPASGRSLSPLPVKECPRLSERRVPGSSPGGSTGVSRYGSAALPSPQPTYVSSPGVRRQRIATLSSLSPCTPGWTRIRVNVGTSGRRGAPNCTRSRPRPETDAPNGTRSRPPPRTADRCPPRPPHNAHPPPREHRPGPASPASAASRSLTKLSPADA